MTVREPALAAAFQILETAFEEQAGAILTRNEAFAERMDDVESVWLNMLDGAPQSPPVELCGGGVEFDHVARIVVMVRGADRDATLDATIATIVSAFPASETLGGAVDFVQVRPAEEVAPEVMDVAVGFKVAVVPLLILYTAPNAAG